MKVLFFINGLAAGGKERRLVELLKGINKYPEIQYELVLMGKDIHYKEVFDLGIKIHYFIRKSKKDLRIFKKLYNYCKEYKPDIIHCWDSMTAIYAGPVCKYFHIKLINGMIVGAPGKMNIFESSYRRARVTFPFSDIVVGNSMAGLSAYRAPKNKSICIHNGFNFSRVENLVDSVLLKEQLKIKSCYIVGTVASFSEYKDYKTFFKAAQILLEKRSDVVFVVVGNNTDSADAFGMIQDKYVSYFRLLGRRSDVESLVNLMDICVLSTFTEGISNSILEYMAMGKPVIATRGGGTDEIVADGETGYLIPQANPEILANKIDFLLTDESLRMKMGESGRRRIAEQFSIQKMVDSYIQIYNCVLKKGDKGRSRIESSGLRI
ncbi:MAG: glycosyltransferase [Chitinophagaceae bacterium]|nr:glycosyltransferase [Chitinophagaceae bacterium]